IRDFHVTGVQTCALPISSLYHYLRAHPQVRPATGKELQYFTLYHGRGQRWYRGHFPRLAPGQVTFEASPYYLFHPSAPRRVAEKIGRASGRERGSINAGS